MPTPTSQITPNAPHQSLVGVTQPSSQFVQPFQPGEVIAGKYRVQKLIGVGGVGFVVAATHVGLDDSVALKFLKPEFAGHQEAVTRFTIEARASFKIKNEHVARVLDVDTLPNGTPFMVMELLEGQDLRTILERHRFLPVDLAVDFALQTCEALAAAHACQIVHRDIKPENLFVMQSGEDDHIKVLDFGISKVALTHQPMPARKTRATALTMMAVGTPPYMSPEQVRASNSLDARADQWSLGCVLYELLTGNAPFERMSLMQACAAVLEEEPLPLREGCPSASAELEQAVMRCLRKDPAQRYADVAELARALAPFGARYKQCAERSAELLAEGHRRSDPGYRPSDPPPLRRSDPLGIRIPTHPPLTTTVTGTVLAGVRPSMRFTPPPNARVTGSSLVPTNAAAPVSVASQAPVKRPAIDPEPTSPITELDLLEAEEVELDAVPGLRPRKNRWMLLVVAALTALSAAYLAVRHSDSTAARSPASRVIRADGEAPAHVVSIPIVEPAPLNAAVEPAGAQAVPVLQPAAIEAQRGADIEAQRTPGAEAPRAKAAPAEPSDVGQPREAPAPVPAPASRRPVKSAPRNEDPDVGF